MHALKVSGSTADIAQIILDLGMGGVKIQAPAALRRGRNPPGPLNTTLGGLQSWYGRFEKTKMSCPCPSRE